ncbi:hypothetical protein B0T16DRAFT_234499 [Cercophora newfieldiana]|uniref:Secreted protein n=1 Tax=Cercophora newfieldiana TaxID=92897 RepID=A0AA40CIZ0_9PEZI|nr:hypothetical protein B0T16DRAFT_234499 [Cercophora newfieldiana]
MFPLARCLLLAVHFRWIYSAGTSAPAVCVRLIAPYGNTEGRQSTRPATCVSRAAMWWRGGRDNFGRINTLCAAHGGHTETDGRRDPDIVQAKIDDVVVDEHPEECSLVAAGNQVTHTTHTHLGGLSVSFLEIILFRCIFGKRVSVRGVIRIVG